MSTAMVLRFSPLEPRSGEKQSTYWIRISKFAEAIIRSNSNDNDSIENLAGILMELPINFDWDRKDSVFTMANEFLSRQSEEVRTQFYNTAIGHAAHYRDRIALLLSFPNGR